MSFQLTKADRLKLRGVHPDLVAVVERAAELSDRPFRVLEGLRTLERQRVLKRDGASKTLNSRHIKAANGYGHAVDIAPLGDNNQVSWAWPLYTPMARAMKQAARELGTPLEWGGDWVRFRDGPHFQLPWKQYPGKTEIAEVDDDEPTNEISIADMRRSGVVQGSAVSGGGGLALFGDGAMELADSLDQGQAYWQTGDIIKIAVGVLIVGGSLYAIYSRWNVVGRPYFPPFSWIFKGGDASD
jgi:peptidoglycan L-alanyl-D-glutamate endopeptidase CwlK